MSVKKFQLITTDATTNVATILFTTEDYTQAITSLNNYVDKTFEIDSKWIKASFENERTVSVYNYFWLWPKKLMFKISVVEYQDCEKFA